MDTTEPGDNSPEMMVSLVDQGMKKINDDHDGNSGVIYIL